MEPHVRERLTGAVVLVVLVVLLVPELFTGPRSTPAPAAEAAGDAGPPMRSYTIDLAADAAARAPAAESVSSAPTPVAPAVAPVTEPASSAAAADGPPESRAALPALPAGGPGAEAGRDAAATARGWAIQLGSFSSRANAQRLVRELGDKGYEAYVLPTRGGSRELFRVRVGSARTREEARALGGRLRSSGYDGTLVPPP